MTVRQTLGRLLIGSSVFAVSMAHAQTAPVTTAPAEASEESAPDIIVTGSRIIRNGNASPSPVTVVATDDLFTVQPGANLADALNTLPVFAGSRGAGSNPSTAGSASGGNGSANQLNLRNLGIQRTLVLVDGVRIPPTLFNGSVDVDLIPQMLVQRVDVVTGGVSAVYGSDAVAGVVNYILDKNFKGLKLEGSIGISTYGDARQVDGGVAWGTDIGDRAHFEASYQYHDSQGILRRSARPWMDQVGVGGLGTAAAPYQLFSGLRQANFPAGGRITCTTTVACPLNGQYFASDGVLAPFVNGTATGTNGLQVGGAGGTWDSSLLQPLTSHQLFGRFSYDFSDAFKVYAQVSATIKSNENFQEYPRLTNVRLRSDNPFLAPQYQTALAAIGPTFQFNRTIENAPRINQVADSKQYFANFGASGDLGGSWKWSVDYVYGQGDLNTQIKNNINNQRLSAALDAVNVGGQTVCYAATQAATAAAYANCVPLNPFGPTATSTAALNYIMGTTNYAARTIMHDGSASVSGSPFDLWAGPVNVALSGEWRKVSFAATSDATSQDFTVCTSLRYNCTANQIAWFLTLSNQPKVSQTVWEVAGELDVPVFKDWIFGKSFNINGAARFTNYNTSGKYWTWKIGFDWALTDTLRLRGTRSRDIRAPTLYDLFAERFVVSVQGTDLLTNTSPTIPSINGGNPNLTAEIANTLTGGIVWKPTTSLSFALDAYRIEVKDAILSVNGGEASFQNACYDSGGTSPYCDLQTRPGGFSRTPANQAASNAWSSVINGLFNISSIKTWGLDLEANLTTTVFDRPFSLRVLTSYQPQLQFAQPNVATREQAGSAFGPVGFAATPEWRVVGFLRVKPTDNFSLDIQQRWRSAMKLSAENNQVWVNNRIAPFATTTINFAWDVPSSMGKFQFYANIANLFDSSPPIGAFYGNGTRAGLRDGYAVGDDARGRTYTAGFRIRM
jgi:iron complex outermembrane recepter protein